MVIRTFFDKNNTIIHNDLINTGLNPVSELFYGGTASKPQYSRFLFYFDVEKLKALYTGGTYTDLTKLKHTLRMTNTGSFDNALLGKNTFDGKLRTSSFDLVVFPINQDWDEGTGYDYEYMQTIGIGNYGDVTNSIRPSNWVEAQTNVAWSGGNGVYTGSTSGLTIASQHFDKGNENIEMDITDYVNGLLTGNTNYGLALAYSRSLELTPSTDLNYVGFFTRHTQTFYEPFVETSYDNHIKDDRANFYLDKANKLYLYVNLNGTPTNLDALPTVGVYDNDDVIFSSYTGSQVTHVTKGVYSIDITVPTTANYTDCSMFTDVWSGITINGITRPNITLDFGLKDSSGYYNIGSNDSLPKRAAFSVTGIKRDERIKRGDVRKVSVSVRIPYTVEQTMSVDKLNYRLYVKEGRNELTVIDYQPIEITNNTNYFLLDTASLIPNTYYLDIQMESNQEITTITEVISFDIVSQSDLRKT